MLVAFECADHAPLLDERDRLEAEYQLLRETAQRLGESLCEIGLALQRAPELIAVMPRSDSELGDNAVVLRTHPPTLLAIERLANQIRDTKNRLEELSDGPPAAGRF